MSFLTKNPKLIEEIIRISKDVGEIILEIYNKSDSDFQLKDDLTPLTEADITAHNIIKENLKSLTPEVPIISEEDSNIPFELRSKWKRYWLVDPLDGTREFIKRNGEFTINIALIENSTPTLGIINIPVTKETYWGSDINGSFYQKDSQEIKRIYADEKELDSMKILASRSHLSEAEKVLFNKFNDYKVIKKGSSLKFCLIAAGEADIYFRLGPTSEWDIAAGHAIAKYAGCYVRDLNGGKIKYNQSETYIKKNFLVSKNKEVLKKIFSVMSE